MTDAEMSDTDYSTQRQRAVVQPQGVGRTVAELIAFPPIMDFLKDLMGSDIVFNRGLFQRSLPWDLDAHRRSAARIESFLL